MTKTICMLAAVALSGAASLFAQDAPPAPGMMPPPPCGKPMPPPPPPCDEMMSLEAQKQIREKEKEIRAIRKAEFEKIKAKKDAFKKLVDEYKANKDEAVKAKIMAELGAAFDAKIQKQQARLDEKKAQKNEFINKAFEDIISGKPCKFGPRGPKCPRDGKPGPGHCGPEGDRPMPPPPPPAK